jgi:hypothetical protein
LGWFTAAVLDLTEFGVLAERFTELWDATIARQWLDVAAHLERAAAGIRAGLAAASADDAEI